jgi:NADH-quinone oxidoreductase subunit C
MDNPQLENFIKALVPEAEVKTGKQFLEVVVPASAFHNLSEKLRNSEETKFDFLFCLTGVDYKEKLGVVYHLRSTTHKNTIVLKVQTTDRVNPAIDSVSDLWKTAEHYENEVYDLLGIKFNNHPFPRRLFMEENAGYPLRKDFVDNINVVTK